MSNDIPRMSNVLYDGNFENPDLLSATALCGHIQAFKYLFNTYQQKKTGENRDQYFMAHSAAASGNLKLLKWIIKNTKCDVTDQDQDGLTILHVACLTANLEIVQWVLHSTHLSPVSRTSEGATSLHFAAWSGSIDIARLIIDTEPRLLNMRMINGATAAMFATQGGFIDLMELLLNEGANFGLPTVDGVNCLHLAAQQGQLEAVKWLVENTGLSLSCKDERGATPIHYAAMSNQHTVVKWLMEKEVRLFKDRFGDNNTFETSSNETLEEMLKLQTKISVTNISGFTALDLVQERLKKVFVDCESGIASTEKNENLSGIGQCSISINVLLLLQSALSELRSQYQNLLRETYHGKRLDGVSNISRDTQTHDMTTNEMRRCSSVTEFKLNSSLEMKSIKCQTEDDLVPVCILPPAPPAAPPIDHAVHFINTLRERRKQRNSRRRGSSAGNDARRSLIEELKEITNLRSKTKKQSDNDATDTDSMASNNDSSSLNDSIKSSPSTLRGSIVDSSPSIISLFNNSKTKIAANDVPKWKSELLTKHVPNNTKDDRHPGRTYEKPTWKNNLVEKDESQSKRTQEDNQRIDDTQCSDATSSSPKGPKVTELVNKWQSNTT